MFSLILSVYLSLHMSSDVATTYALDFMTLLIGMAAMDHCLNVMEECSELLEDSLGIIENQLDHYLGSLRHS